METLIIKLALAVVFFADCIWTINLIGEPREPITKQRAILALYFNLVVVASILVI